MARYFFHIRSEDVLTEDERGAECPDPEAARHEAVRAAKDALKSDPDCLQDRFIICDASGRTVAVVPFWHALPPNG
jgi:hypothetical protein